MGFYKNINNFHTKIEELMNRRESISNANWRWTIRYSSFSNDLYLIKAEHGRYLKGSILVKDSDICEIYDLLLNPSNSKWCTLDFRQDGNFIVRDGLFNTVKIYHSYGHI